MNHKKSHHDKTFFDGKHKERLHFVTHLTLHVVYLPNTRNNEKVGIIILRILSTTTNT